MAHPVKEAEYGTFLWLCREIAASLNESRNEGEWGYDLRKRIEGYVNSGYMQMLSPPPLAAPREGAPAPKPHIWSFLTPLSRMALTSGEDRYLMPEDCTGVVSDFTVL